MHIKNTIKLSSSIVLSLFMMSACGGGGGTPSTSGTTTANNTQRPTNNGHINPSLCAGKHTDIKLLSEVKGDLNIEANSTTNCHKVYLSSNNGSEEYTFYLNLLPGTQGFSSFEATLIDDAGTETPLNTGTIYDEGKNIRKTFSVTRDGYYYIKVNRSRDAAKYALSIYPSIENGLKQNEDREPNDTPSMAAAITLADAQKDIKGSLHFTRDALDSRRNTDNEDYYSINIEKTGKYTFFMNLLPGTDSISKVDVRLITEETAEIPLSPTSFSFYKEGNKIRKEVDLTAGKYNLKISRDQKIAKYAFSLHPSIVNGLIQDNDKEPNDTPSMAAPISLNEDVIGSLHVTREALNSLRNSDDTDYYSIDINTAGDYNFTMNLLNGTEQASKVNVRLISEDTAAEIPLSPTSFSFYKEGHSINKIVTLSTGKYKLKIDRASSKVKYNFKLKRSN